MSAKEDKKKYLELKTQAKKNVLTRLIVDIDKEDTEVKVSVLKKDIDNFRPREIDELGEEKKTEGERTFCLLMRKLEHYCIQHLKVYIKDIKEDKIKVKKVLKDVEKIDIDSLLPDIPPDLPTTVIIGKTDKKESIQLTNNDSIRQKTVVEPILKKAKNGKLYDVRSKLIFATSNDGLLVAIGRFNEKFEQAELDDEDILLCKENKYLYQLKGGKIEGSDKLQKETDSVSESQKKPKKKNTKKKNKDTDDEESSNKKSEKEDSEKEGEDSEKEGESSKKKKGKSKKKKDTDDEESNNKKSEKEDSEKEGESSKKKKKGKSKKKNKKDKDEDDE